MTLLKASDARREFFRILDAVEGGEEVVLERRGVRFRLVMEEKEPARKRRRRWGFSRGEAGARRAVPRPAVASGGAGWMTPSARD